MEGLQGIYQNCIGSVSYASDRGMFFCKIGKHHLQIRLNTLKELHSILKKVDLEQHLLDIRPQFDYYTLPIIFGDQQEIRLNLYELIQTMDLLEGTFFMLSLDDILDRLNITAQVGLQEVLV